MLGFRFARHRLAWGGRPFPWSAFLLTRSGAEQLPPLALTFIPLPPLRRPSGPLATLAHRSAEAARCSRVPLLEFLKDRPSTGFIVCVHSRLPEVRVCHTRTRSALVVPPDFGGFLRTRLRRFVAPCNQSWGSPGFLPTCMAYAKPVDIPPSALSPSKFFPSVAGDLSPGSLPPRRCSDGTEVPSLLGLEALLHSRVSHHRCFHRRCFELPWGSLDPGFHRSVRSFGERCPCGRSCSDTLLGAPLPRSLVGRWHP